MRQPADGPRAGDAERRNATIVYRRARQIFATPLYAVSILALGAACSDAPPEELDAGVRQVLEFAVLEVPVDKIVFARAEQRLLWFSIGTATHVAESRALVRLGVRADAISADDVRREADGTLVVTLPPVEVLDFEYQPESFVVREDLSRRSPFRRLSLAEREQVYRAAEADLRENLPYGELFERTRERLRVLVAAYLERFADHVRVEFREAG